MKPPYRLHIQPKYPTRNTQAGDWVGVNKGTGYEFWGLRKYLPGDSFAHIDWKARARSGELYVREFLRDSTYTLMLVVDVSASMGYGQKFPLARDIASSLAWDALQNSNPCGLLLFADRVLEYLPPTATGRQYQKLLAALGKARPTACRQTRLQPAIEQLATLLPSFLGVIISDFHGPLGSLSSLGSVVAGNRSPAHEILALHLLEETEWQVPSLAGQVPLQDMESGNTLTVDLTQRSANELVMRRWRNQQIRKLAQAGIDSTILVAGRDNLQQKINALFARRLAARI